jgi:exonuclease 3'-5' domain-containing protein 1
MVKDTVFIDSLQGIKDLVDWVALQDTWMGDLQPPLYIDLEGDRLSRNGNLSLLTVLVYPGKGLERPHIIDTLTLGSAAFSTAGRRAKSLKDILESPQILKVFFDVRNDSDALYSHYGIKLRGVRDVQLMESATRPTTERRKFLSGLSKCIVDVLHGRERNQWTICKEKGDNLWNPENGGSYSVFNARPLSNEIASYCVGDVQHLPALYQKYRCGTNRWTDLIAEESQKRVSASQESEYQPDGAGRALSPWSAEQNKMLDSWSEVPKPRDYFSYGRLGDFEEDTWESDRSFGDDNDFEDWTRAPWQGPPS